MAAGAGKRQPHTLIVDAVAPASVITVTTPVTAPLTVLVGNGVTVASVGTADTVQFTTFAGTLLDRDADPVLNSILGFRTGDAIDLSAMAFASGASVLTDMPGAPGTMQLADAAGDTATLNFPNSGLLASDFTLADDGAGGTVLALSPTAPVAFWTGSGAGLWSSAANWSGGLVPQRGIAVGIYGTYSAIPLSVAVSSGTAGSIVLDAANGTLTATGGLVVAGTIAVTNGMLAIQPGVAVSAANVRMGQFTGLTLSAGSVLVLTGGSNPEAEPGTPALEADWSTVVSGGTVTAAGGSLLIGSNSTGAQGQFTAVGARVSAQLTALGSNLRSYGQLVINGGIWTDGGKTANPLSGDMIIGNGGQGDLTVEGGGLLSDSRDALFGAPEFSPTGSGGVASALVTGGGRWIVGGNMTGNAAPAVLGAPLLTVGADSTGAGTLTVAGTISGMSIEIDGGRVSGGVFTSSTAILNAGAMTLTTLASGGTLAVGNAGTVQITAASGGGVTLDATSVMRIGIGALPGAGTLRIEPGTKATLDGGISAPTLDVQGTLSGGVADFSYAGVLTGSGTLTPQANLELALTQSFAGSVVLTPFNTLTLDDGTQFTGVIDAQWFSFGPGDGFTQVYADLPNLPIDTATSLWNPDLGVASLGTLAPFSFAAPGQTGDYNIGWTLTDDGNGGSLIGFDAATVCYASGTAIATPRGAAAVEALRPGDTVLARRDGAWTPQTVRWVGQFSVDLTRHPCPDSAAPVLIRAGAISAGVPARDLRVSPDHAVWVDGALIPARLLVNGATVARDRAVRRVTYHHVELDRHALLLAEGLPAESYLDTGNRAQFAAEAGVRPLFPDLAATGWRADALAPLLTDGAVLAQVRRRLAARARRLGWRWLRGPAPSLRADGRWLEMLRTGRLRWATTVPHGTRTLHLFSRSFVPHDLDPASPDRRSLGLAVHALTLNGRNLAGPGAGWHPAEPGWRWTTGCAVLPVAGGGVLDLHCANAAPGYWVPPQTIACDEVHTTAIVIK